MRGEVNAAEGESDCVLVLEELESRLSAAEHEFETIASERVAEEKKRAEIVAMLMRWRIHGKPRRGLRQEPVDGDEAASAASD